MSKEAMKLALEATYLAGFNASGEGYNGEYGIDYPEQDVNWINNRNEALAAIAPLVFVRRTKQWADGSPWFEGLSLRDYFAAKAMQGLCALPSDFESNIHLCEASAKVAYMQADAMLKAREA